MLSNESVEVTCSHLIETVTDELNRRKDEKQTNELEDISDANEDMDPNYDELMENLIIEEFGRCLVKIIDTAEKRH